VGKVGSSGKKRKSFEKRQEHSTTGVSGPSSASVPTTHAAPLAFVTVQTSTTTFESVAARPVSCLKVQGAGTAPPVRAISS
jgi:hypothetical protein